jgi:xanthine dehydrogenase YagR molybdenum-binding subunit
MSVGQPLERVDGRAKVTGAARYTTEHSLPNVAHAVLVMSAIAKGRVTSMDTAAAERVRGVLAVMTPMNTDKLPSPAGAGAPSRPAVRVLQLLQDDVVHYANQPIGVVVAETLEAAQEAAALVRVHYGPQRHDVRFEPRLAEAAAPKNAGRPDQPPAHARGDVDGALAQAEVKVEQVYRTPFETHVPMEPHATIAAWDGPGRLTLYDATQGIFGCRGRVAGLLGLKPDDVRVVSEYLGGGFGSKGPTWSHVVLAAMAARRVSRPVKLALARPQTFGPVGFRSRTHQAIALGARRDGTLTALRHDTIAQTSAFDEFMEPASVPARMLYAVANVSTSHKLVRADIGTPSYMRAPGWAPGSYALEVALDELAVALDMDPLTLRLKNYAERDPEKNVPWSSKTLRECYRVGAQRFGWNQRPQATRTLREGHTLIGWGMATSVYPTHRSKAGARARLRRDGTVLVEAGTQDIGTGTYTVMTQVAADALGIPPSQVVFRLGDTAFPETPVSGGSQTAASVGSAVHAAATALREKLAALAGGSRESLAALAARHGEVEAAGEAKPGDDDTQFGMYAFGAQFAEVRVDADLGQIRVARMVGVFDMGRALNARTARSQLMGGMVWGIGMALTEAGVLDERLGRIVNNNLAEYHVPVNADAPAIDVGWIEAADAHVNPIGVKGIGELGITGATAAIANAVYHATGRRVRDLPITPDRLL